MKRRSALILALAGFAWSFCGAGCASPPNVRDPAATGAFAIIGERPAGNAVAARELHPLEPRQLVYRIVIADEANRDTFVFDIQQTDRFNAAVAVEQSDGRTAFRAENDEGDVVLTATIDNAENALTLFNPPLVIAPAQLKAGEPITARSAMRVLDAKNPSRKRESGTGTQTIEYVGDEDVRTPSGTFRAKRIEFRFEADLRMANAHTRETCWLVPGRGIIARERAERIDILGLPGSERRQTLVLIEE